jgi:ubiquinone/menaquinone biosynthesis C-methylase UbiE
MHRRNVPEAMDGRDLDPGLLADDLRNLETLNRLFAGRSVVRRRLEEVLAGSRGPLRVLDVGSGSGDLCRAIVEACRRWGRAVRLVSLDAHPQVQECARQAMGDGYPEVRFLRGDGRRLPLRDGCVDLALCTLTLHHFTEEGAAAVLSEMRRVTRRWAIVSDLHRSPAAYGAVWFATRFVSNPMTRYDGPVSARRAFTAGELLNLARAAGWKDAVFHCEPWFRMSLVYRKNEGG